MGACESAFLHALAETRAPIEDISLHGFSGGFYLEMAAALQHTRAPLCTMRLCQFFWINGRETHIVEALLRRQHALQRIVLQSRRFEDRRIEEVRALFRPSADAEAVLRAVGQHAAKIIRPMIAPAVHCARSSECACEL
jgi:hypothetical protein